MATKVTTGKLESVKTRAPERRRACIFCGDSSRPLTLEHLAPLWLQEVMVGEGLMNHAYRDPGEEQPAREWSKVEPDFKARMVCGPCNHGWMSDLEGRAKPLLKPFIQGRADWRVNYRNASVAARWATKTALMFQASEGPHKRIFPSRLYHALTKAEGVPAEMRVWIGAVEAAGLWSRAFGGTFRLVGRQIPAYFGLLAIDRVSFLIVAADEVDPVRTLQLGHLSNAWVPLWPFAGPASWPPPYTFPPDQFPAMPQLLEILVGAGSSRPRAVRRR